jgi:hypothetical protein
MKYLGRLVKRTYLVAVFGLLVGILALHLLALALKLM